MIENDKGQDEKKIKSDRAKARWAILRSALITSAKANSSKSNGDNSSAMKHSIHRFAGFSLLDHRIIPSPHTNDDNIIKEIGTNIDDDDDFEFVEYTIPIQNGERSFSIRTREKRTFHHQKKKDLKSLMSHVHHGVDNTGQTRVWDSSNVLTYCLFRPSPLCFSGCQTDSSLLLFEKIILSCGQRDSISVVELGAGMAGLPSLALATYFNILHSTTIKDSIASSIHVTITDGHPNAIENNKICASLLPDLCHTKGNKASSMSIQHLLWKEDEVGAQECQKLVFEKNKKMLSSSLLDGYDIVLVSDCTHFQEFHAALLATIGRLLCVGGMAILCQPHRSNSLTRFMNLVESIPNNLFTMKLYDNYNEKLYNLHQQYKAKTEFNPDIHYPVLLVLQKQREYIEEKDTVAALSHMKTRDEHNGKTN